MHAILNKLSLLIISIIGGILASNHFDIAIPAHLILICGVAMLLTYLITKRTKYILIALCLTSSLLGAFLQQHHSKQWYTQANFYSSYTMNLRGTVTDLENLNPETKQRITIYTHQTQLGPHELWQPAGAYITVYIENKNQPQIGDFVEINEIKCAQLTTQTRELLRHRGIVAQAYRIRKIQLLSRPAISCKRLLHTFKYSTSQKLKEKLSPPTYSLFSMIFLGKRVMDRNDNTDDYFGYWGLNHYLARAGLHLALLFLMLNLLTSLFMLPASKKACTNLGVCIGYYCLTWTNIPFMRALTVIVGQQLCTILSIPINSIHLLNLTFLFYVVSNTHGIFYLDVQLTFAITYAILLAVKHRAPTTIGLLCKK